jgi:hypothetical protein
MYLKINSYKTDKNTTCNSLGSRTNKQNCWEEDEGCKKRRKDKSKFHKKNYWHPDPRGPDVLELLDLPSRSKVTSDIDHNLNKNKNEKVEQYFSNFTVPVKIIISSLKMLSMTIYLTLLKQTVESNPGEIKTTNKVSILSYNCNGLGNKDKLRRLLTKLNSTVEKGGIVFLQETHIVDTSYLKMIWPHAFISNCFKTNSAGVMILFRKKYEVKKEFKDEEGRIIVVTLEHEDNKMILANTYFPNDHKQGIHHAEKLCIKI